VFIWKVIVEFPCSTFNWYWIHILWNLEILCDLIIGYIVWLHTEDDCASL